MATKNIVPRASSEGGLGRQDKPWGSLHANYIPAIDKVVLNHNTGDSHEGGIAGNAATATKLKTPVTINNVAFDGSRDIEIGFGGGHEFFTEQEITDLFNQVINA